STFEYKDVTKPLASGATNTVVLTAKASGAGTTPVTRTYTFITPAYTTIPADAAVTGVDTTKPGFNIKVHQVEAGTENTIARAEQQLAGLRGADLSDKSAFTAGVFTETDTINYNQDAPGNAGAFNGGGVDNFAREDRGIPGIPGSASNPTDNIAAEITTYIQFPEAGVYTLIFNSDDGFRTYLSEGDVLGSLVVSQADVGRGATDSPVTLLVPTPGFYPFRTVWFEGGGGANFEWNAINTSGVRALLNDSTVPGSLKTYRARTGSKPAAVTFTTPVRGSGNPYLASEPIIVEVSGTAASGVSLTLDGAAITPSVNGNRLTYTSPTLLASGNHTVGVSFGTYTNSLTFTTAGYSTVPVSMRLKDSDVDKTKPGFLMKVHQQANGNGAGNNVAPRERQIAGFLGYPNVADPGAGPAIGANGYRVVEDVINYNQDAPGNAGNFNGNSGFEDKPIPGIPGTTGSTDNIAAEILTVVEFPTAGLWILGFNSDDGFATYVGDVRDEVQFRVGVFDGGRGASDTLYGVNIQQPGLYPVRTLWFEGGGGANFEWFVWNPVTRTRILLNDNSTTGALKTYQYPLGRAGAAYVKAIAPKSGSQHVPVGRDIKVVVAAGSQTLDPATARMTLAVAGGAAVEVQPMATLANGELTISYTPKAGELPLNAGNPANNNVTARVWYGDRGFSTSFATTRNADADSGKSRATFFIEAEDFNFGGGQADPAASNMSTYRGGAYSGRSATAGVDYQRGNEGASPLYRIDENPQVPMDPTGDIDRGVSTLLINYKMGWIGGGQWYNYTRTFPEGKYNVYVGASHGDGPANATALSGSLQRVTAGATTANQTLADIGSYSAPGTGGWGNNNVVPVRDSQGGLAEVALSGAQTIRWSPSNGDIDFLLFAPAVASKVIAYSVNGAGKLVLTFPAGAVLTSSASLGGAYAPVAGASSPYTVDAMADAQFFKLQ
ncbi:MAG: PA14 domain-containing protein, partial [Verrucomicrobiota bacterium]